MIAGEGSRPRDPLRPAPGAVSAVGKSKLKGEASRLRRALPLSRRFAACAGLTDTPRAWRRR